MKSINHCSERKEKYGWLCRLAQRTAAVAITLSLPCVSGLSQTAVKNAVLHDIWTIQPDRSIEWKVADGQSHTDHIEMSGKSISVVLRYGVNKEGAFFANKSLVFPLLRTIPNNTHGSLQRRTNWNILDMISVNGFSLNNEKVQSISLRGIMKVESDCRINWDKMHISRTFFPSVDKPCFIEQYVLTNKSNVVMAVELPHFRSVIETDPSKGVDGHVYDIVCQLHTNGVTYLKPGESMQFTATDAAYIKGQELSDIHADAELAARKANVDFWMNHLVLESPDSIVNTMFAFSKIRACESIYATKGGPMHGPGGEAYYAAIWANDQAEYINPYFPFTGYRYGDESALNAYLHFARFMNKDWNPIPSSIIAEGIDIWFGAGDRGDAAMIAYGASRYALARGSKVEAQKLWPLIQWCLEYCRRKINTDGVVASKTDELEGRFPTGKANLNTSSLYYDALLSAAYLNEELGGKADVSKDYRARATEMRTNINRYFGHNMEGYETYAYYQGNDRLRAWICTPLVMGIDERAKGTIEALFSPHLWTENGLLSQEGSNTFWDRSTLYALRGAFYVGETQKAIDFLKYYSEKRLLCDHVPYAIEAWPEGEQRHLSAESGLYGRVITEGLFGVRPIGLRRFTMIPRLPKEWSGMALRHIGAFEQNFDIEVARKGSDRIDVRVMNEGKRVWHRTVKEGTLLMVQL